MNNKNEKIRNITPDWLKVIYVETWKQYIHEDLLTQNRIIFFTTLQGFLITILVYFAKPIIEINKILIWDSLFRVNIGWFLLGLFIIIICVLNIIINSILLSTIKEEHQYLHLRGFNLQIIEKIAEIDEIGPASIEGRWKESSKIDVNEDFVLNHSYPDFKIHNLKPSTGFISLYSIIKVWMAFNSIISFFGICIVFLSFYF